MEQERRHYSFRNLALWQRGQELALEIIRMTERLPDTIPARVIARQVVSSSSSVPANIAEGHGRYSVASYRNHLSIARGSVCETETWIDLLQRAGYIGSDLEEELVRRCRELLAGLTGQMQALERKLSSEGTRKIGEDGVAYDTNWRSDVEAQ
jgi:four helix bundle protein